MSNNSNNFSVFHWLKNFFEKWYYFSPSYYFYMLIKIKKEKEIEVKRERMLKDIKDKISEVMKYFFYFIDLVFISFILLNNTIHKFKDEASNDEIFYIIITGLVIIIALYCIHKIDEYVSKEKIENDRMDLLEKIIEVNDYKKSDSDPRYKKYYKFFKRSILEVALKNTIFLGIFMYIIGYISLQNKYIEEFVVIISVYYFIMRVIHYWVVFYKDFKNKNNKGTVQTAYKKNRYIELALFNYVKIILEFCILIYIFKYMGWQFVNIKIDTYFELVYIVVMGNLEATTSIEMLINLSRIITLGFVITLNLATYMSLEVENKSADNYSEV